MTNYSDELWKPEYRCKQCGEPYDLYSWIMDGKKLLGREWKCREHEDTYFEPEAVSRAPEFLEGKQRKQQEFWGEEPVLYDFDSGQEIIY